MNQEQDFDMRVERKAMRLAAGFILLCAWATVLTVLLRILNE